MKTYIEFGHLYYYDTNIKLWTIYEIDKEGNQISREADHYQNREQLKKAYPFLTFKTV